MPWKITWVRYGEVHEEILDTKKGAEQLQRFLLQEGFGSQITEAI
jgi:hypothetical protein